MLQRPGSTRRARLRALAVVSLVVLPSPAIIAAPPALTAVRPAVWALGTYVRGPDRMVAGTPAALRVATHWASSPTESGPVEGVQVEITLAGADRRATLFRGRSDGGGVVDARFAAPDWPEGRYTLTVTSQLEGRSDKSEHAVEIASSGKVLLESDKPLYQPSQVVHLRAVAVRPQDGRPVGGRKLLFDVADPRGNRVFRVERTTSEFGVAAADFTLADEILLGAYRARAELVDGGAPAADLELRVERYSLPRFKLAVETDRGWYLPGETVRVSLDARYFFGKPVARGHASVRVEAGVGPRLTHKLELDGEGRGRLEVVVPRGLADGATVALVADVTDGAEHSERARRELTVAVEPVRLEVVAEAGVLLPGVDNQVWVVAAFPDGKPVIDREVTLRSGSDGAPQRGRTDAIGVAQLTVRPTVAMATAAAHDGCSPGQAALKVEVQQVALQRCVTVDGKGGLLVRPARALHGPGDPLEVEVLSAGDGVVFLDVVKDGQTVDTAAVTVRGGRGSVRLAADERRFGTLALRAYRIDADGRQTHDARLVHVSRTAALRVEVRPQAKAATGSFTPGEEGKIRVKVVDAVSGAPARASVGLVMVDQAVLALRAIRPGAARTYFTLAAEASRAGGKLHARPAGHTVERLVEEGDTSALRQEAARVLLAGAAPAWAIGWEVDPWARRRAAAVEQQRRIQGAMPAYARDHFAGERAPGGQWHWRRDLLAAMIADGALPSTDRHDPWQRPLSSEELVKGARLGTFERHAAAQLDERLTAIYEALVADKDKLAHDGDGKEVRISLRDLERLVAAGRLRRALLRDPWNNPWRIEERARPVRVAGLRSRFVVASNGPDGSRSRDDRYAMEDSCSRSCGSRWPISIQGRPAAEAFARRTGMCGCGSSYGYGYGGLGLHGVGYGGGGRGEGTIGLGSIGTIGRGSGRGGDEGEARVRRDFPETMLWRPEVVTDAAGEAVVDVTMADSITSWRLTAEAIAADGRLGEAGVDVRVFQDFFADLDLPPVATQHDEIAVPVAVHNYLAQPQRVTLQLDDAPWFERVGDAASGAQSIDLAPDQVGVRYFRIRVRGVGRQQLRVRAVGTSARDTVERSVQVFPDGVERDVAFQDRLGGGGLVVRHRLEIPADAIADASLASVKVYPGMATHVIEGLDSMLRMPGGCFEQTSSTTYPNALILDYLKKSKKATPDVEKKAQTYLAAGYQRLLSFEVAGGGFSWFGQAPANQVLTAYGLEEFHDMARVFPIDERVIARTRAWLAARQRDDGSWAPDTSFINEGATNRYNHDVTRITAYIALSIARTDPRRGAGDATVEKARAYVRRNLRGVSDAYTLALALELLAGGPGGDDDGLAERLWRARHEDGKTISFGGGGDEKTPTYGDGRSGLVETTAVATTALLATPHPPLDRADRAVAYLLGNKDTFGSWHSTQATIRALKALLGYQARRAAGGRGRVTITVDGAVAGTLDVGQDDALQVLDLGRAAAPGKHDVELRYEGRGEVAYQLVGRFYQPTAHGGRSASSDGSGDLTVTSRLDVGDRELKVGDATALRVHAEARGATVDMPMVTAGLPPGFDVDGEALEALVQKKLVEKVQRTPREVIFYLRSLAPGKPIDLAVPLSARLPVKVTVPSATVYEYYRPERRAVAPPLEITVGG